MLTKRARRAAGNGCWPPTASRHAKPVPVSQFARLRALRHPTPARCRTLNFLALCPRTRSVNLIPMSNAHNVARYLAPPKSRSRSGLVPLVTTHPRRKTKFDGTNLPAVPAILQYTLYIVEFVLCSPLSRQRFSHSYDGVLMHSIRRSPKSVRFLSPMPRTCRSASTVVGLRLASSRRVVS